MRMPVLAKTALLVPLLLWSFHLSADVEQVTNAELKKLRDQGIALIDVRRPDEWASSGIIEGSHLLTFFDKNGRYDVQKWLSQLDEIAPDDEPFVLICEVGGRTGNITRLLDEKLGFTGVHNLTKGIRHWINSGELTVAAESK